MKLSFTRLQFLLSKKTSRISSRFIWVSLAVIAAIIIFIPWLGVWFKPFGCISKFFVDILSPVSLRYISYGNGDYRWYSSFAYAIGVIVISGLLISIITTYLRNIGDRYNSGTLDRYSWNNHILFLGFDELMVGTIRKMCGYKKQVVVTAPDKVESARIRLKALLTETEFACVEVIQCNASDKDDLLDKACVCGASHLFIVGQPDDATHDASNLKSLDVIANILGDDTNVYCYLNIRNRASLSLLQRQGFVDDNDKKLRRIVTPFNIYENTAARLLTGFDSGNTVMTLDYHSDEKNLADNPESNVHLVILGMTEVGMALARETLMVAHYPGHNVKITLVDENAREEMYYFKGRYKELFRYCKSSFYNLDWGKVKEPVVYPVENDMLDVEFEFIQGSIAHPELMVKIENWAQDEKQILTLVVCTNDSPKNMAMALYLPRPLLEGSKTVPVWVYQQGDNSLKEFSAHEFYKKLYTFSASEYGSVELQDSLSIEWAVNVANAYNRTSMSGCTEKKWNDLSQYERWSSLYNARSVIAKLRSLGYELRKEDDRVTLWQFSNGEKTKCTYLYLTDEQIEKVSETEHLRWMTDTLIKGFRRTSDEEHQSILSDKSNKNKYKKDRFAHDDLRPYSELDSVTASYDRDMTLAMVNAINSQIRK